MTSLSIRSDSEPDASLSARFTTRDVLVGGWMIATIIAYYHNFLFLQSLELTYVYAFVSYGIGVVYAYVDGLVQKLVAIGTIGGILELLGDHFLVHVADSLVYPYQYSPVLSSPIYMPFAWAVLIVFMGYVAVRLREEVGVVAAYLGPAVFAFVSESGYESLASQGGGWSYVSAPLGWIGHAPLFIVVAEAVMFASSYYWVKQNPVKGGIGIGLTINASYVGVYYLFVALSVLS